MDADRGLALVQEAAVKFIRPRFQRLLAGQVAEKAPDDLVTVADREAEAWLVHEVLAVHPGAFVLGEEAAATDSTALRRFRTAAHAFTIDPLDGTVNFVAGSPNHAVMMSELRSGEVVRAWIWQPELGVSWVAERGAGVLRNGARVAALPPAESLRGVTSIHALQGKTLAGLPPLQKSWQCCGVDYPQVLTGSADFAVFRNHRPWGHAPGSLLVAEMGGRVALGDGMVYKPRGSDRGVIVAHDPRTAAAVLGPACSALDRFRRG